MKVKVYVEGGGDHNHALQAECRRGFSELIRKAGLGGRMPRVVACGGRRKAYEDFRTSHGAGANFSILLVDSEAPLTLASGWEHVKLRPGDQWERPDGASDDQIHFMVQAMESWFHADMSALEEYYGNDFRANALSRRNEIEEIARDELLSGMKQATSQCQKGAYSKGRHSFEILARIDPAKVRNASPHADRFLSVLDRVCTL